MIAIGDLDTTGCLVQVIASFIVYFTAVATTDIGC